MSVKAGVLAVDVGAVGSAFTAGGTAPRIAIASAHAAARGRKRREGFGLGTLSMFDSCSGSTTTSET
jgi:hypothetical protein